jgi:hypothetical protein
LTAPVQERAARAIPVASAADIKCGRLRWGYSHPSGIAGVSSATMSLAPVLANISVTLTPGARSRSASPSSLGSINASSVTMRLTRRVLRGDDQS